MNAEEIGQQLDSYTLRMESILLLAGMLFEDDSAPALLEWFEEQDAKSLCECFPDFPSRLLEIPSRDDDDDDDQDDSENLKFSFDYWLGEFKAWAIRKEKLGFLVQFARPRFVFNKDGSSRYSWRLYYLQWIYADSIEQAVDLAKLWADRCDTKDRKRAGVGA